MKRIAPLDGLRSLAIFLVLAGHCATRLQLFAPLSDLHQFLQFPLVRFAWSGVDLFFVLSGFLIGNQLWKEFQTTQKIRVKRFLVRRALRIFPLYFIYLALALILAPSDELQRIWPDFLFLTNYFNQSVLEGSWSLSIEEQFYLLAPFFVAWMGRMASVKRVPTAVFIFCLAPLIRLLTLQFQLSYFHFSDLFLVSQYLQKPLQTHFDGLLMGLILAYLDVFHSTLIQKIAPQWVLAVAGSLGVMLGLSNPPLLGYSGFALLYGGAVWWGVANRRSFLINLLSARPCHFVSKLSYGMYLNHFFLMPIIGNLERSILKDCNAIAFFFIYFFSLAGASLAVSSITFMAIEIPFFRLSRRWRTKSDPVA